MFVFQILFPQISANYMGSHFSMVWCGYGSAFRFADAGAGSAFCLGMLVRRCELSKFLAPHVLSSPTLQPLELVTREVSQTMSPAF